MAELLAQMIARSSARSGIVDAQGRSATYTGPNCFPWAGGIAGPNFAAQGNILVGEATVRAMAETFQQAQGTLWRIGWWRRWRRGSAREATVAASNPPRCSSCVRRRLRRLQRPHDRSARGRASAADRGAGAPARLSTSCSFSSRSPKTCCQLTDAGNGAAATTDALRRLSRSASPASSTRRPSRRWSATADAKTWRSACCTTPPTQRLDRKVIDYMRAQIK